MPDLFWLLTPPYIYSILGVIFFSAAVVSTCTGKTFSGYGGWAFRVKEPTQFWWAVAILYLAGFPWCAFCMRSTRSEALIRALRLFESIEGAANRHV